MGRALLRLATYIMTRAHPVKAHLPAGRRLGWRDPGRTFQRVPGEDTARARAPSQTWTGRALDRVRALLYSLRKYGEPAKLDWRLRKRAFGAHHTLAGQVAEWLRSGLQSRVHRFDSGPGLQL